MSWWLFSLILVNYFWPAQKTAPVPVILPAISPTLTQTPPARPTPKPSPTPTPSSRPTPQPTPTLAPNQHLVYMTLYGYPDNDPPGREIAYPKHRYPNSSHDEAGGAGSYTDPITLAAARDQFEVGTRFYLPYIQKYAVLEDWCATCGADHLDLWLNSNDNHTEAVAACQRRWTRRQILVESDPPSDKPVNLTPLFNPETGTCLE